MPGIDAHQHFWKYDPVRDNWITDDMTVIRRDFLPVDLEPLLRQNSFEGTVLVQSDQSEEENTFQLKNAEENQFIKAIVGWVDLQAANVEERLDYYSSFKKMKGFRHILQGEVQRDLMLSQHFMKGISKLAGSGYTYDILIFPDQLQYIPEFISSFPNQKFVIDHMAKPNIRDRRITEWRKELDEVARHENVYCKVSGMVTEADWNDWRKEDFVPYLEVVVNAFGTKRIMYGSDWPVCLLAGSYDKVLGIVKEYFSTFSKNEQEMFFGENATRFYNIQ